MNKELSLEDRIKLVSKGIIQDPNIIPFKRDGKVVGAYVFDISYFDNEEKSDGK